jgi:hypothetical protein
MYANRGEVFVTSVVCQVPKYGNRLLVGLTKHAFYVALPYFKTHFSWFFLYLPVKVRGLVTVGFQIVWVYRVSGGETYFR